MPDPHTREKTTTPGVRRNRIGNDKKDYDFEHKK